MPCYTLVQWFSTNKACMCRHRSTCFNRHVRLMNPHSCITAPLTHTHTHTHTTHTNTNTDTNTNTSQQHTWYCLSLHHGMPKLVSQFPTGSMGGICGNRPCISKDSRDDAYMWERAQCQHKQHLPSWYLVR